jgi:hypothetical protein
MATAQLESLEKRLNALTLDGARLDKTISQTKTQLDEMEGKLNQNTGVNEFEEESDRFEHLSIE